jgi:DNA helicase-4
VDRDQYLEDMTWKRQLHQEHGTTLIETFSWESEEGRLLEALAEKLKPHIEARPRAPAEIFDRVVEMGQAGDAVRLLGTFLRRYKSGGYTVEACWARAEAMGLGARAQAFLAMFGAVLTEYQRRLDGRIDFEDMIARATAHVEAGRFASPFRHLLVDEFQDISQGRARLLKALLGQAPDTKLFAVGDDWQSIFRFAGSDIQIMRHFGEEFGRPLGDRAGVYRAVDLGRTFRSVDRIALPARAFVLRNPQQITKEVKPAGEAPGPAIRVVSTRREDAGDRLAQALAALADLARLEVRPASVLLLGRYRKQEPANLAGLRRRFPGLQITWKTVHASKGLEADHVIILGLDAGGFPSEVADDPLLGLVTPEAETFEHAEERRLMYVAMTRARRTLTLLASAERPSAFVTELRADPVYGLVQDDQVEATAGLCAACGGRLLASPGPNGRIRHRCEHARLCGHSLPTCPTCGTGLPRRDVGGAIATCMCGAVHPACPACEDGWLVERKGRHGTFRGCVNYPACQGKARSRGESRSNKGTSGQLSAGSAEVLK